MKKVEKTFKKGIDKGKAVWYNSQAVRPKGKTESARSLKIEQQKSTKHNLCTHERVKNDSTILFNQSK